MSTRSNIAIETKDGKIKAVYCHSDGYIKGVGKTLINNYKNYDDVEQLKSDMSEIKNLLLNLARG